LDTLTVLRDCRQGCHIIVTPPGTFVPPIFTDGIPGTGGPGPIIAEAAAPPIGGTAPPCLHQADVANCLDGCIEVALA
jgi:hypothetical protein